MIDEELLWLFAIFLGIVLLTVMILIGN